MVSHFLRVGLFISVAFLAGCNGSLDDMAPAAASKELSSKRVAELRAKGMAVTSPIMVRIFKEEGKLEVWKQKSNGRYDIAASYDICKYSGKLGPKFIEGDRQAPEGFYSVRPAQMNPNSSYHLSFNMGFPNAYDRVNGRTGQHLMVHGGCSSSGCYSMSDGQVSEIYAFAREAFKGGQNDFQIQAFPFRMTASNMARYKSDPNYQFWTMLKEGYDHFEITKLPPKVDVCEKRYVFNRLSESGQDFSPNGSCPSSAQPEALQTAYQTYSRKYDAAFSMATSGSRAIAPISSIGGLKEAEVVAEWTKRRARGERVPMDPPSLNGDGTISQTTDRMGRIDSPAGRRMAELEAKQLAAQKLKEEQEEARIAKSLPQAAPTPQSPQAAPAPTPALAAAPAAEAQALVATAASGTGEAELPAADAATSEAAPAKKTGLLGNLGKRMGLIGG